MFNTSLPNLIQGADFLKRNKNIHVAILLLILILGVLIVHVILNVNVYIVYSASLGTIFMIGLIIFLIVLLIFKT
ncbi:hypothetical protein V7147_06700 [Bacillus sp. JJ1521]|uniref:hypothetical protein n=1 Tax=Bacillus sp. JJ1521 TaxID=3122957 RepID=UPI002FFE2326